jgi:hypothetical protein
VRDPRLHRCHVVRLEIADEHGIAVTRSRSSRSERGAVVLRPAGARRTASAMRANPERRASLSDTHARA